MHTPAPSYTYSLTPPTHYIHIAKVTGFFLLQRIKVYSAGKLVAKNKVIIMYVLEIKVEYKVHFTSIHTDE